MVDDFESVLKRKEMERIIFVYVLMIKKKKKEKKNFFNNMLVLEYFSPTKKISRPSSTGTSCTT